eukprot:CAMPEP_0197454200 /NCGR_PEP_ID=MMETSP1175-20131217/37249_1 /TAXON_ID=1003142 /ORGANISM="Triceratium dubium, Strain CCMP147" /LENGTH=67 /DNA_ID=CAMNT_0042987717 /DNA_START=13 /DNA_END=212 /DNA_ORIENTATION=+
MTKRVLFFLFLVMSLMRVRSRMMAQLEPPVTIALEKAIDERLYSTVKHVTTEDFQRDGCDLSHFVAG